MILFSVAGVEPRVVMLSLVGLYPAQSLGSKNIQMLTTLNLKMRKDVLTSVTRACNLAELGVGLSVESINLLQVGGSVLWSALLFELLGGVIYKSEEDKSSVYVCVVE